MPLLVLPPAFTALIGEVAGWRSFTWYGRAAGALAAAQPFLARPRGAQALLPAEGRIATILFLAGAVAGLVYWLVAGCGAGPALGASSPLRS